MSGYKLLVVLCIFTVLGVITGEYAPEVIQKIMYNTSTFIKQIIEFFIPILIFTSLMSSMVSLGLNALKLYTIIIPAICISGFICMWFTYGICSVFILKTAHVNIAASVQNLNGFGIEFFKPLMTSKTALITSFICGILSSKFPSTPVIVNKMKNYVEGIFINIIVPLLPLLIMGFVVKLQHDGIFVGFIKNNGALILVVLLMQIFYLGAFACISSYCSWKEIKTYISNVLPAAFAGFVSMSSAAALPLTIEAAAKVSGEKSLAKTILSATVNFHMLGNYIFVPFLAIWVMPHFPSAYDFFVFSIYFIIAHFSVAAVPGGSIMILLQVCQEFLHIEDGMASIIFTVDMILNNFITSINIMGNFILALIITRIFKYVTK